MPYKLLNFSLAKFKHHPDMSEETNCFSADVHYKGKRVGYAKNSGHGGCTNFDWDISVNRERRDEISDSLKGKEIYYPPGNGKVDSFSVKLNIPELVEDLCASEITLKAMKTYIGKKGVKTKVSFINADKDSEEFRDILTFLIPRGIKFTPAVEASIRSTKQLDAEIWKCVNALEPEGLLKLAKKLGILAESQIRDIEQPQS